MSLVGAADSGSVPGRRSDVLQLLRSGPDGYTVSEVADQLGVHVNTARFHLHELMRRGQVQILDSQRGRPGRPAQRFKVVSGMDPGGIRDYQALAEVLIATVVDGPGAKQRAIEAGRSWGRQIAQSTAASDGSASDPAARLVAVLDRLGFVPDPPQCDEHGQRIALRSCPFLELAQEHREVVCPVHLGLMRGALESWGAPLTIDRLEPFNQPDLCLAHLAPVEA